MKSTLPSKTALKKILSECVIDPRKPGPMKVIADMSDPDFFRKRAIEYLSEGNLIDNEQKAISLLSLAIYYNTIKGTPQRKPK